MYSEIERKQIEKSWFSNYSGPEWFKTYMLDGESTYRFNGEMLENLECAVCNRINSSLCTNDPKGIGQVRTQRSIDRLTTDKQCVGFIKRWVDPKFSLKAYLQSK